VAAKVSSDAHIALMKDVTAGLNEFNLQAYFLYYSNNCGLLHQSYSPIVGSGNASAILHYTANNRWIQDGSLILVDAGAEYLGYGADITRTYPENGKFSADQKLIYEMVLNAQDAVENMMKPGTKWSDMDTTAKTIISQSLLDAGFLQGTLADIMKYRVYGLFYPHGLGHFLGLDVHDPGVYPSTLKKNMVLTVEPGIYFNSAFIQSGLNDPNIKPFLVMDKINAILNSNFGGVRIEDDVIVTDTGVELISQVPKTVHDIEELMKKN